jgi:hypothetical protein
MRLRLSFSIFTLAILFTSSSLQAEQANDTNWYSIEYIVFENNPLGEKALEPWTKEAFQMPVDAIALNRFGVNTNSKAFSPLLVGQQQLHGVANKLKRLSAYTPIVHGGWIQPLKEKKTLQPIQIIQQANTTQLEGTLTFHRGKYLHLDIDLQLSEMVAATINDSYVTNSTIQPATLYRLKETRRIKTSKSHYFDHPRFGVLMIVEKIDSPEEAISTTDLIDEKVDIETTETVTPPTTKINEN